MPRAPGVRGTRGEKGEVGKMFNRSGMVSSAEVGGNCIALRRAERERETQRVRPPSTFFHR